MWRTSRCLSTGSQPVVLSDDAARHNQHHGGLTERLRRTRPKQDQHE